MKELNQNLLINLENKDITKITIDELYKLYFESKIATIKVANGFQFFLDEE